jgi:hypothetical protein
MATYMPQTVMNLVRMGANINFDDAPYLPQTLLEIAAIAKLTGAKITISGSYLPQTLEQLAQILGNNLTIVLRNQRRD